MRRLLAPIARTAGFVARVLLVLAVVEGSVSLVRVAWRAWARAPRPLAERAHTEYDAELGWVNRPHVALPDLYGPGASLHTNGRRFRGRRETALAVPPGRTRAICSGDSFALGYGVDDEATWCHRLEGLVPGLETVNMGQGGYGVDQAWLWFARDGDPLEHRLHLFSFIVEDFARMEASSFFGYGKPRLRVEDGVLRVDNVPVPRAPYALPWLASLVPALGELETVRVGRALLGRARRSVPAGDAPGGASDLPELVRAVFSALARTHRDAGRTLVLIWLPMQEEASAALHGPWRRFLREEADRLSVPFLDLSEALRGVPAAEVPSLFLAPGEIDFPAAAGHYSVRGNRAVASWIADRLRARGLLGP